MKKRPGALSPAVNGAVGKQAVSSTAQQGTGDLERRRKHLIEELYVQNAQVAESLAAQIRNVADLDDDALSKSLWQIQVAVLWFDRQLRRRR